MVWHEPRMWSPRAGVRRWNTQQLFSEVDNKGNELVSLEEFNQAREWLRKLKERIGTELKYDSTGNQIFPRKTNQQVNWENTIKLYNIQGNLRRDWKKVKDERKRILKVNLAQQRKISKEYIGIEQRYEITSPVSRGNYTMSIRDILPAEVEDLRSKGYTLRRVTPDVALMRAITIPKEVREVTSFKKRARVGIGEKRITTTLKTIPRSVIIKSFYNPRNVFMEQGMDRMFEEVYYDPRGKRYINVKPSTANRLRKRGWRLYKQRRGGESKRPSGKREIQRQEKFLRHEQFQDTDISVQLMQVELANLKAWIEKINQRTTQQLLDLGRSTTERRSEIKTTEEQLASHQKWIDEINTRVSQQLVDLGGAVTEQSKIMELQKAQKVVQDVKKGGGGFMGGITSFFTTPSNLILIAIVVIMLIMIRMK